MTSLSVTSHNIFWVLINAWVALICCFFFPYARSSHQKKSACNISGAANTKKNLYFESFISGEWGGHCFTERDFPEVEIVTSPLIFEK